MCILKPVYVRECQKITQGNYKFSHLFVVFSEKPVTSVACFHKKKKNLTMPETLKETVNSVPYSGMSTQSTCTNTHTYIQVAHYGSLQRHSSSKTQQYIIKHHAVSTGSTLAFTMENTSTFSLFTSAIKT